MSKKIWIILAAILVGGSLAGAGGYYLYTTKIKSQPQTQLLTETLNNSLSETKVNSQENLYQDDSGFSFNYPASLAVKDITPADDSYYSELSLTKGFDALDITVKDTTATSITDWLASETSLPKNATAIGATTFGGVNSKQYTASGKLYSVAIDQGVLYLITSPKDGGFWEDAQNKILTTFKFGLQNNTATTDQSGDNSNTTYEEEVVQ